MEFLMTEVLRYVEGSTPPEGPTEEQAIFAKEQSAAKLERMGYSVGFRLCERLAQNRTFSGATATAATTAAAAASSAANNAKDPAQAVAAAQLEAVKFLCKEVWMEVFRKQIDKLQTNHRGVFVLKDLELKWLTRLPSHQETARVTAIQLLAFPCGIVRGALSNLGIPAVVSCDFLSDGHNMAACSFNIKIK
jgi:trafficking protein particle complex subunit 6